MTIPRVWDDPEKREKEKEEDDAGEHLVGLAGRIRAAMDRWTGAVAELGRWITCGLPPPGRMEDPFDDGDDGEPETVH